MAVWKMKSELNMNGAIQQIGLDPFSVYIWSSTRIHVYNSFCSSEYAKVYIDDTGNIVKQISKPSSEKRSYIFLYDIVIRSTASQVNNQYSVGSMLSETQNAVAIHSWLAHFIRSGASIPMECVTDMSLPLIYAFFLGFNKGKDTFKFHQTLLQRNFQKTIFKEKCYIRIDVAHFIKLNAVALSDTEDQNYMEQPTQCEILKQWLKKRCATGSVEDIVGGNDSPNYRSSDKEDEKEQALESIKDNNKERNFEGEEALPLVENGSEKDIIDNTMTEDQNNVNTVTGDLQNEYSGCTNKNNSLNDLKTSENVNKIFEVDILSAPIVIERKTAFGRKLPYIALISENIIDDPNEIFIDNPNEIIIDDPITITFDNSIQFYPNTPQRKGKKTSQKTSFILSSSSWKQLHDEKELEKRAELEEKENRKKGRELKKVTRERAALEKQTNKKQGIKRTKQKINISKKIKLDNRTSAPLQKIPKEILHDSSGDDEPLCTLITTKVQVHQEDTKGKIENADFENMKPGTKINLISQHILAPTTEERKLYKRKLALREISIHTQIRHPNIVQMMGYSYGTSVVHVVMELVDTLHNILFEDYVEEICQLDGGKKTLISLQMAGDVDSDSESSEKKGPDELNCGVCKRKLVKDDVSCVLCDNAFHKSCITRLKSTINVTNDKVMCCLGKEVKVEKVAVCISNLLKDLSYKNKEVSLLNVLIKETQEKNALLQEKNDYLKEKLHNLEGKQTLFSDVVQGKTSSTGTGTYVNNIPAVIIKPKGNQDVKRTRNELDKSIHPAKLQVEEKLSKTYYIELTKLQKPKIKIIGYSGNSEDREELEDQICQQNEIMDRQNIKINYIRTTRDHKKTIFAETSPELFRRLIQMKKIYVGWQRLPIYEDLTLMKCFKCQEYNHKRDQCSYQVVCSHCGKNHEYKDCDQQTKCCGNCVKANNRFGLSYDISHTSYDIECPTMIFYKQKLKAKIDYGL
ncbi:unnamed protein product [Ceutorhynchus assimilis]|uniref:Protein kinase domain-containing protein n=1 Tax=Ceutorhynchus assimilis TaxID=467358 RepID=A0A9N9MSJ5_9CUCU|nr:unnamed protein product [Ceutorhynchus assimilis]